MLCSAQRHYCHLLVVLACRLLVQVLSWEQWWLFHCLAKSASTWTGLMSSIYLVMHWLLNVVTVPNISSKSHWQKKTKNNGHELWALLIRKKRGKMHSGIFSRCCLFVRPGAVGLLWFILWSFFVFDSPNTHPRISEEERRYITSSLKNEVMTS